MTPEERARACATRIENKLTGPDPRGGSEEDLLGLAVHCFETAVAEIKAEIRAAVEEEREGCARIIRYTDMEGRGRCDECGALWDSEHDDSCIVPAIRARSET